MQEAQQALGVPPTGILKSFKPSTIGNPRKLEHGFRRIGAGSLLYKGLRILMFQLSGVYCKP